MVFKVLSVATILALTFGEDLISKFHQNDYHVKDIRLELESYNPKILKFVNLTTYKHNRTTPAVNASWDYFVDVYDTTEVVVQGYKFASNEYRNFPIRFQISVLKGYKANIGGLQKAEEKCGYLNGTYYIKNTVYYMCQFVIDPSRFPPLIPSGRFRFVLTFTTLNYEDYASVSFYAEIYRPIYPPKSKKTLK